MSEKKKPYLPVKVNCPVGSQVTLDGQFGHVKRLLRDGGTKDEPHITALVYWNGGRKSFESEKNLRPVYA